MGQSVYCKKNEKEQKEAGAVPRYKGKIKSRYE